MADIIGINDPQLNMITPNLANVILVENETETGRMTLQEVKDLIMERANDAGIQGEYNFSVAPCPPAKVPSWLYEMEGTWNKYSATRGNYRDIYGGEWCYFPRTWVKISSAPEAPYYGTKVEIKSVYAYATEAEANADGYHVDRSFINNGKLLDGWFHAKFKPSLVGYVDGSAGMPMPIRGGNPISSAATTKRNSTNPTYPGSFSNCKSNGQSPTDDYKGAMEAVKAINTACHAATIFQNSYIALVAQAQAQAAVGTANCAWKDVLPYAPKGRNKSGALGDVNDSGVTFQNPSDGYWNGRLEAAKNGSGSPFSKTTHNGCPNGVADVNGNQLTVLPGMTAIVTSKAITAISIAAEAVFTSNTHGYTNGLRIMLSGTATPAEWSTQLSEKMYTVEVIDVNSYKLKNNGVYISTAARTAAYTSGISSYYGTFYAYKESVDVAAVTSTQHFDPTWIAANCDVITPNFVDGTVGQCFGNGTNQVLDGNVDRTTNAYRLTACGLPMANGFSTSGTNSFGADYYYQYYRHLLCVLGSGLWSNTTYAGASFRYLSNYGTYSTTYGTVFASLNVL